MDFGSQNQGCFKGSEAGESYARNLFTVFNTHSVNIQCSHIDSKMWGYYLEELVLNCGGGKKTA